MSGSSASSRSGMAASEDRPRAIGNRAGVAGGVHRQPAPRAQRPARGQHRFRLFGKGADLVVAEPETHAGQGIVRLCPPPPPLLARAGHALLPPLGVPPPHPPTPPFGLAGLEERAGSRMVRRLDALRL